MDPLLKKNALPAEQIRHECGSANLAIGAARRATANELVL
jgi:hypothetical protein